MKDERLEVLSDMVRKGEPIPMGAALEVIEYQKRLRELREERRKRWQALWYSTPIGMVIQYIKSKIK